MKMAAAAQLETNGKCMITDRPCDCAEHNYAAHLLKERTEAKKRRDDLKMAAAAHLEINGKCMITDRPCDCAQHKNAAFLLRGRVYKMGVDEEDTVEEDGSNMDDEPSSSTVSSSSTPILDPLPLSKKAAFLCCEEDDGENIVLPQFTDVPYVNSAGNPKKRKQNSSTIEAFGNPKKEKNKVKKTLRRKQQLRDMTKRKDPEFVAAEKKLTARQLKRSVMKIWCSVRKISRLPLLLSRKRR